ncbi:MAG: polysaccharide deacetylase family protein [Anaerolineae bacterium]
MSQEGSASSPWPDGRRGAISLSFDDGLESQLEYAVPLLEGHGMRATFYVNPEGKRWQQNTPRWQAVVASGHEVGNHTLGHWCSRAFRDAPGDAPSLETMTIEQIEADVLEAQARLAQALPGQADWTFCYPCYQDYVGEGATRRSYVPVIAHHFIAGRGRGEFANHPATCDLAYSWSWPAERLGGDTLIGMAETAVAQGRWGIFTFHGIGEGHLPVVAYDFGQFLGHLQRHGERIWVAPVVQVAQRIRDWRGVA